MGVVVAVDDLEPHQLDDEDAEEQNDQRPQRCEERVVAARRLSLIALARSLSVVRPQVRVHVGLELHR